MRSCSLRGTLPVEHERFGAAADAACRACARALRSRPARAAARRESRRGPGSATQNARASLCRFRHLVAGRVRARGARAGILANRSAGMQASRPMPTPPVVDVERRARAPHGAGRAAPPRPCCSPPLATVGAAALLARWLGDGAVVLRAAALALGGGALLLWLAARQLRRRAFGAANAVTLVRAALVRAARRAARRRAGGALGWVLVGLGVAAVALDGVDGALARRRSEASAFGARFDMETDALLILVLAALVWQHGKAGVWILAAGLLRYVFVAASWALPWLGAALPPSRRRQAVCVVQIVSLIGALAPARRAAVERRAGARRARGARLVVRRRRRLARAARARREDADEAANALARAAVARARRRAARLECRADVSATSGRRCGSCRAPSSRSSSACCCSRSSRGRRSCGRSARRRSSALTLLVLVLRARPLRRGHGAGALWPARESVLGQPASAEGRRDAGRGRAVVARRLLVARRSSRCSPR